MKRLIYLFICLMFLSLQTQAARYTIQQLSEDNIGAINSAGTLAGITASGAPFIWVRDSDSGYLESTKLELTPLPSTITHNGIFIVDISDPIINTNETATDSDAISGDTVEGETVIGWYEDSNGNPQSVIWLKRKIINERNRYEYKLVEIAPLIIRATPCSGDNEVDYGIPECVSQQDAEMIYQALQCPENANWQPGNNILVDLDYQSGATFPANCSKSLPICDFKIGNVTFLSKPLGQGNESTEIIRTANYLFNHEYVEQRCVAESHVAVIQTAFECAEENSVWDVEDLKSPIIQCDKASKVTGINNNGLIAGTSIRKDDFERPIFWLESDSLDDNDLPRFDSGDLGASRKIAYQTNGDDANKSTARLIREDIIARTRTPIIVANVSIAERSFQQRIVSSEDLTQNNIEALNNEDGIYEPTAIVDQLFTITFKQGKTVNINKTRSAITGFLRFNSEDAIEQPVYWPTVSLTGVEDPIQLYRPEFSGSNTGGCPPSYQAFQLSDSVSLGGAAAGTITGWYSKNEQTIPLSWGSRNCTDAAGAATDYFGASEIETFDEQSTGKALDNNSSERIGTTDRRNSNGDLEPRAFYNTNICGTQDLNDLLVTPNDAITLTEAIHLAASVGATPIVAKGLNHDSNQAGTFVLTPEKVFVDLSVNIASNKDELTVGEQQALFVTITNDGAPSDDLTANYATCIKFKVLATVVENPDLGKRIDENGNTVTKVTSADIATEQIGGLTFESYRANAEDKVFCNPSIVTIDCTIERINPGQSIIIELVTRPRPLLADRTLRTSVTVGASESETLQSQNDNIADLKIDVKREACFIATAAYGSYMAAEVKALREFRDNVLLTSDWGRWLVDFYYATSPPLAEVISHNELLKKLTRWALTPIVYSVLHPFTALGICLLAIVAILFWRKQKPKNLRQTAS